ncbi:glycosyl hydrolase family 95 catalytic domain-containing protein [Pseudoxanthomonas putridarboris]|uniref:Glycosyl hydrolase family 95 catalytic domain-containing protein n=1 Tax=Pseudoxanthomonas putridarboris TaxID=752605 RepID=A0ABU9J2B7_9GAMM
MNRHGLRALLLSAVLALPGMPALAASAAGDDVAARVARSNIFVGQPNILESQAMPLGNGRLGAAVWAADGLTVQLNRADGLPDRLSPGWLVVPGLQRMTRDRGFRAHLDLHDGEWHQAGGGMTARVYVDQRSDRLVVDVAGAEPGQEQTAFLKLWSPRAPSAAARGAVALLAEHWRDDQRPGASGRPFGTLAALSAEAGDVRAERIDDRTVALRFRPLADGRFRLVVAAPAYDGGRDAFDVAADALSPPLDAAASRRDWHDFWQRAALITAQSDNGAAQYAEQIRTLFLYASAAHNDATGQVRIPGSQAGVADLFSSLRDDHMWDPAAFWGWNLRMQVAANLSAGLPELNRPFFSLYRDNLEAVRDWTLAKMGGRPGICIPETMRFNGVGVEYEGTRFRPFPIVTHSCDLGWSSTSNARTLTTGAEVGLWIWETYLKTGDREFLSEHFPLMAEAARFLRAYQQPGDDGLLHTRPSNAHETQHDVFDPATDISAIRALYPAVIAASRLLDRETALADDLARALPLTPELPLAPATGEPDPLLPVAARTSGPVFAPSHDATAHARNSENIGLEAVWPYGIVGPGHPAFDVARRTYAYRPFRHLATWSNDPIHAARLGWGDEVERSIHALVQVYQAFPNGLASFSGTGGEFYLEQAGVVAAALSEALVQDNGDIRIAPAIPAGWSVDGTVYVRGDARIAVAVRAGQPRRVVIAGGSDTVLTLVNPWPGQRIERTDAGRTTLLPSGDRVRVSVAKGDTVTLAPQGGGDVAALAPPGEAAARSLGRSSIGLPPPCCAAPEGYRPDTDRPPYREPSP